MASTVWRGYISFGLVSIPVRLFRAARSDRIRLREVYRIPAEREEVPEPSARSAQQMPAGARTQGDSPGTEDVAEIDAAISPVRRVAASDSGKQILPPAAVTKGYEYQKDRFVTLTREEIKALAPKTATQMELVEFVKLQSVDLVYFETSYYVQPDQAGEKPYALLYSSLRQTGLVGVARIAMHSREHIVIVRSGQSGLIAHTMYFSSEVRKDQEYKTDTDLVGAKELELASTLVNALAGEFTPEKYHDTYREELENVIAQKIAGRPVISASQAISAKPAADIMEALRKSLAVVKKPAASAGSARDRNRGRRSKRN